MTSPEVLGAQAAARIRKMRETCAAEIAAAPESILARYDAKEAKALDALAPNVRAIAEAILGVG